MDERTEPSVPPTRQRRTGLVLHSLDNGRNAGCALEGASAVAFEHRPSVAKPNASRGHRGNTGLYYAASLRAHVPYATWLARDEAMVLDFDREIRRYAASPFRLSWPGGSVRSHVPTFFARREDGSATVIDCRADRRTHQHADRPAHHDGYRQDGARADRQRVERAELQEIYAGVGWTYLLVSDHDRIQISNLQWLSGYRHPRYDVPAIAIRLLHRFAHPTRLNAGIDQLGNPLAVLPVLYHLLWRQRLSVDLSKVLDGSAVISNEER